MCIRDRHLNDSRDEQGSGRDRHANLGEGLIDPDELAEVVRSFDGDVVLETPSADGGHARDLAWVRDRC